MPPVSEPAALAFAALTLALLTLWAPRLLVRPRAIEWWVLPFVAALGAAVSGGLIDTRGLVGLLALGTACRVSHHAPDGGRRGFAHAVLLLMCAGVLLHVLPGFANPRLLDGVQLSADAVPYTKYLNIDKGQLGLFLLGLYAPARGAAGDPLRLGRRFLVGFTILAVVAMTLTVLAGYARWDPKLPPWWPLWLWSMVFLTALPEEAVFRHLIQGGLQNWLGGAGRERLLAAVVAGVLFGLAHFGGGWTFVALATVAGIGYGWIYAATGSIAAAILAHTGLNLLHLLFFSYPALRAVP